MIKRKTVIEVYERNLIKRQNKLEDKLSIIGRKKDYEIQKIDKKYQSQIDDILREQKAVQLEIGIVKDYVNAIGKPEKIKPAPTTKKRG